MSQRPVILMGAEGIRARLGRGIAIALAIVAGVAFVVGSFVLADSLKRTFDNLFTELNEFVDLEVRSQLAFGDTAETRRDPIPAALADDVAAVEGVAAIEPLLQRYAQLVKPDGEAVTTQGAPTLGVAWSGSETLGGVTLREGEAPAGGEQMAIDKATADREDFAVGDRVEVLTDTGRFTFTVSGLVALSDDADGFAGATLVAWDLATAQDVLGAEDMVDAIDLSLAEGADPATVTAALEEILPPRTEVVTGEQVAQENTDGVNQFIDVFGTGLLIFAFVTAFISAFIINNVFSITIGQRLRELALMRAVGASGSQVRRMIVLEALVMALVATVVGIFAGIGIARLLVSFFNAAGAGFPSTATVLAPRTVVMAFVVGVGITVLSVFVPARRASKVPPVAAMRPELGFAAINTRRLVVGVITTVVGAAMFLAGLFLRPGGTIGLIALAGGGGLVLFIGAASLSGTVARPVTRALGWPIAKLFRIPGTLARDNAGRAPRRTAASASALMIGVALVSAAAIFASSLRATFSAILEDAVTADYIITDNSGGFTGLSPNVAEALAEVPELSAVTPIRTADVRIDGDTKTVGAAAPTALGELVNLDIVEGDYATLEEMDTIFVHKDPVDDLELELGTTLDATFQNGVERTLTVVGVYNDASLAGNWLVSLDTLESITNQPPLDFFVVARVADGVDAATANRAVEAAMEQYPQANVQTNAEFREDQEGQIDQLLAIISGLLGFAIIIAVLGISITLALAVYERTREIGLLRAVGMNRRQTRRTVRWEAVIVSLFGAVVGIVLGSLLGVALSLAVPETVIDRLSWSPSTTIAILIGAVIAGLIAALYPSFKASRMDVLQAIATE